MVLQCLGCGAVSRRAYLVVGHIQLFRHRDRLGLVHVRRWMQEGQDE